MSASVRLQAVAFASACLLALVYPWRAQAFCTSPIYCEGPVLDTVQKARIFNDSKTFVDSPTSKPVDQVLAAFQTLGQSPTVDAVRAFYDANFLPAGSEVVRVLPHDWDSQPAFLSRIADSNLRKFGLSLNSRWLKLVRSFNATSPCDGCAVSSIPLSRPFVVAGGRFREAYYWDSYFILRGLLVSEMFSTAEGVIYNMLDLVDKYGFMPNGARIYYLNRSQPPLLTQMVWAYYDRTRDTSFLRRALPTLEKEYDFWMNNRTVSIPGSGSNETHILNIYNVQNTKPRPEGYTEDLKTAAALNGSAKDAQALYGKISSACESGWDFSSRWNKEPTVLSSIQTPRIVPVDLNAILYLAERTLAEFHKILSAENRNGTDPAAVPQRQQEFTAAADARRNSMIALLWDDARGMWRDYDWATAKHAQPDVAWYASSLVPLWAGVTDRNVSEGTDKPDPRSQSVVRASDRGLSGFVGGVPTSLTENDEQWDFPKAWPPLQYFAIKGILRSKVEGADQLAGSLIRRWVDTNYCGWALTGGLNATFNETVNPFAETPGDMFEKYDAEKIGIPAGGGEYDVQEGFGWTNGVMLSLLDEYAIKYNLTAPESCQELSDETSGNDEETNGSSSGGGFSSLLATVSSHPAIAAGGGLAVVAGLGAISLAYRRRARSSTSECGEQLEMV